MYFIRVAALSSILMAYIGEEGISLKDAHLEIYGDGPAEGEMP
jgi:hypothetical protein